MQFRYKVIDEQMRIAAGLLEADDRAAARQKVIDNRWQLIELQEVSGINRFLQRSLQAKIKYESLAAFCSQMAMMIRSGANLVRGLEILQAQIEDRRLKEVVKAVHQGVSRGNSLAQAMRDTGGALPELLINLVSVGEESGTLDSVLTSMAEYYERENFIRKKITSAAIYPLVLTMVLLGLVSFFLGFILPEITALMRDNGQNLPLITQIIVNVAHFWQTNAWKLAAGLLLGAALLVRLLQIPRIAYGRDALLLHLPLFGKNIKNVVIARFSRTLALFLHSSLPIVPILDSLAKIVGNQVPRQALARARERVIRGETLAAAFGQEPFFDPLVIQMMSIGEETGRLEELMAEVANHYDKRVEIGIARLVALVEPLFTVVIGVFAGGLIIAVALPIFNMANVVR